MNKNMEKLRAGIMATIRASELQFVKEFCQENDIPNCGVSSLEWQQARALWTAYCLHFGLEPDTGTYDSDFLEVYYAAFGNEDGEQEETSEGDSDVSYFDAFDLFMGSNLC